MKKSSLSIVSLIVALAMMLSSFCLIMSACSKSENPPANESTSGTGTTGNQTESTSKDSSSEATEGTGSTDTTNSESTNNGETEEGTVNGESSEGTDSEDDSSESNNSENNTTESESQPSNDSDVNNEDVVLDEIYKDSIIYANDIANGVQTGFVEAERDNYIINNLNTSVLYALKNTPDKMVTAISNKNGGNYIEKTMDVFVKMTDGNVYYASDSLNNARSNIFRLGYYYYDVHFLDQDFTGNIGYEENGFDVDLNLFNKWRESVKAVKFSSKTGELRAIIGATVSDPYMYMSGSDFSYSAEDYNVVVLSVKAQQTSSMKIYYVSSDCPNPDKGHTDEMKVEFEITPDGEYHTYAVPIFKGAYYSGSISKFRVDFEGSAPGEEIFIKDMKLVKADTMGPDISLDRVFHTYPDKLHQELHFVSGSGQEGIAELGMITKISADTVAKLVVKDKNGVKDTLEGIDWDSAEYIGFDIKDVGVFGYILPVHENTGKMTVELVDGYYVITQASTPKDGKIDAPVNDTSNDYRMGQRIYTDENHDFAEFLKEAEIERNPLESVVSSKYIGYNALNGAYEFSIGGTNFNAPFLYEWNYHYLTEAVFRGDDVQRNIYVRTKTTAGCLENAVLLNGSDLVIPIPMEVSKNFGSEKEEPLFDRGDTSYGETVFPLSIAPKQKIEAKILNIYQNWGNFPIKQLSSIQYFWPYYHLSVGTTETSCISPWYGARDLWTLPDFRSQSMPYWWDLEGDSYSNQPQHTHGGYQYFLQYTDADGNYNATENISNVINSSGPIYADVDMTYISDDGKIKVVYKHLEMPQMDELRAYYEISYEILEEVTIKDFANDFSFYSFEGYSGYYTKMGYWAENGDSDGVVHKETNGTSNPEKLVLGNDSPYVALYDLVAKDPKSDWAVNNVNLGFVLYNSEIVIGGEAKDDNFVVIGKNYVYSLSMDLGEVTLKPGDVINLNMIITPWGWTSPEDDINMQKIRENTCLDPLTVEVTKGEAIESAYLPRIKSVDGKTAEFTLSGGTDNVAVRVYGFDLHTAPYIEEYVNGQWVEYVVSSINNPDKYDNKHYYDGFYTYYDEDGTLSYAFAVNMTDCDSRTFRVSADKEFTKWPKIPVVENETPVDVYVSADSMFIKTEQGAHGITGSELLSEDGVKFVRIYPDGEKGESYFSPYSAGSESIVSGKYIAIKYRLPETNSKKSNIQFFTSTVNGSAVAGDDTTVNAAAIHADGQWHIMFIDASKAIGTFKSADDGYYYAKHLRIDIFNSVMSAEDYIDLAYFAIFDELEDLCKLEENKGMADYISSGGIAGSLDLVNNILDAEGEILERDPVDLGDETVFNANSNAKVYFSPKMLYNKSLGSAVGVGNVSLSSDGTSYVRFFGNNGIHHESFFKAYTEGGEGIITGQYLVLKYRVYTSNGEKTSFEFYAGTSNKTETDAEKAIINTGSVIDDNEWHIAIIDLSNEISTFVANADGKYAALHLRLDVINCAIMSNKSYVDVAYLALTDSLESICALNGNSGSGNVIVNGDIAKEINLATGEIKDAIPPVSNDPQDYGYIHPLSEYNKSETPYVSSIDFINGKGDGDGAYDSKRSSNNAGVVVINYNGNTSGNAYLALAGWTMTKNGVSKYMWSADGGLTWNECTVLNRANGIGDAVGGILDVGKAYFADDNFSNVANSAYQGNEGSPSGVAAHLTDYIGETVNVIFAVVPEGESDSLCVIGYVTNVKVYASDEDAEAADRETIENCQHTQPIGDRIFVDDGDDNHDEVMYKTTCICGERTFESSEPNYVFFFEKVVGSVDIGNKFMATENKHGVKQLDAKDLFTADANNKITMKGWGGMDGGIETIVFQVYDQNGNQLTDGWTATDSIAFSGAEDAIKAEMTKRGIDENTATRINNIVFNLDPYYSDEVTSVTLKVAYVSKGAVEAGCEDRYLPMAEIHNIEKAQ